MPNPDQVNQKRFPVASTDVLHNDGNVSLAFSVYKPHNGEPSEAVGVRWNYKHGKSDTGQGYPNYGKNPTWFILPTEIAIATLTGLLQLRRMGSDLNRISEALKRLERLPKDA